MKTDLIALTNELNEKGIFKIPEYIDSSTLISLNNEFDNAINKANTGIKITPYSLGNCARVNANEFDKSKFPETTNVFYSTFFKKIAENYLGSDINLNEEIFMVKDVVESKHYANDLHYDVVKTFKFFIYLTDTTSENGAFQCVPGSHKKTEEYRVKYGDKINFNNREITRKLDLEDFSPPISIEGKAGTLIIFDTDLWHRAGKVFKGERKVMRGHTRKTNLTKQLKKRSLFNILFNK